MYNLTLYIKCNKKIIYIHIICFCISKYPSSSCNYKLSFNWVSNISSFKWVFLFMDLDRCWWVECLFRSFTTKLHYSNAPRLTGQVGGVATIFKEHLNCRHLPSYLYSSFELSIFELSLAYPVLCVVVYRPPKYNKDLIDDFSDFWLELC